MERRKCSVPQACVHFLSFIFHYCLLISWEVDSLTMCTRLGENTNGTPLFKQVNGEVDK